MESVNGIRPVQTTSQAPARFGAQIERQVARTELPEAKVVTAAARVSDTAIKIERQPQVEAEQTKRIIRDEATKELVFRTVSAKTGEVVSQYPDEAILRERAYRANQERQERLLADRTKPADSVEPVGAQQAVGSIVSRGG